VPQAALYGADDKVLGGLNSFYLLLDTPETYGLPSNPKLPSRNVYMASFLSIVTACLTALGVLFAFREGKRPDLPSPSGRGVGGLGSTASGRSVAAIG
jgi:formate dehydrogenase iron-sulfur subunit